MSEFPTEEGFFSARDGLRLFWQTVSPAGTPRADIVLLHGFAEHLGRHLEITRALVVAGFAVHLVDVRGHGQSGGRRAFVERFDDYLADLDLFLAKARERAQRRPFFLVAHSHGALIGARFIIERGGGFDGAVLSSPYFGLKMPVSRIKIFAGKLIGRVLPGLPMKNAIQPELLTRDVAIQQATRADPLYLQMVTPRWFTESTRAQTEVLREAARFTAPLLCLVATDDPIADPAAMKLFVERAGSSDKSLLEYPGLLHEIFHEPERDRVFRDVIGWLNARLPASTAAAAGARP